MLTSDARQRFERGVDPAFLDTGLAVATWLVTEHCGGTPSEVTRAGSPPTDKRSISYDPTKCLQLGGVDVAADRQKAILEALGFEVADDWTITIPTWRRDIQGWQDIVEEVVRVSKDSIKFHPHHCRVFRGWPNQLLLPSNWPSAKHEGQRRRAVSTKS